MFYFKAESNSIVTIQGKDKSCGLQGYTAEVFYSVYNEDLSRFYFVDEEVVYDNPVDILPKEIGGYIKIKVFGAYASTSGTFALRYY